PEQAPGGGDLVEGARERLLEGGAVQDAGGDASADVEIEDLLAEARRRDRDAGAGVVAGGGRRVAHAPHALVTAASGGGAGPELALAPGGDGAHRPVAVLRGDVVDLRGDGEPGLVRAFDRLGPRASDRALAVDLAAVFDELLPAFDAGRRPDVGGRDAELRHQQGGALPIEVPIAARLERVGEPARVQTVAHVVDRAEARALAIHERSADAGDTIALEASAVAGVEALVALHGGDGVEHRGPGTLRDGGVRVARDPRHRLAARSPLGGARGLEVGAGAAVDDHRGEDDGTYDQRIGERHDGTDPAAAPACAGRPERL